MPADPDRELGPAAILEIERGWLGGVGARSNRHRCRRRGCQVDLDRGAGQAGACPWRRQADGELACGQGTSIDCDHEYNRSSQIRCACGRWRWPGSWAVGERSLAIDALRSAVDHDSVKVEVRTGAAHAVPERGDDLCRKVRLRSCCGGIHGRSRVPAIRRRSWRLGRDRPHCCLVWRVASNRHGWVGDGVAVGAPIGWSVGRVRNAIRTTVTTTATSAIAPAVPSNETLRRSCVARRRNSELSPASGGKLARQRSPAPVNSSSISSCGSMLAFIAASTAADPGPLRGST